jgi:hypothetical protein
MIIPTKTPHKRKYFLQFSPIRKSTISTTHPSSAIRLPVVHIPRRRTEAIVNVTYLFHLDANNNPTGKMRDAQSVLYCPIVAIARPSNIIEPMRFSPSTPYFCPRAIRESPTHTEMIIRKSTRKLSISRLKEKERKTKRNIRV